jgi:antirestriction protein ArdC
MAIDLYQIVTDKILARMEAGTAPWVKPWATTAGGGLPYNASSGKPYRGVNVFLLAMSAPGDGDGWMTYKQAQALGANVRKGEHGSMIVFFKPWTVTDKNAPVKADGSANERTIPVLRSFTVFHTSQIDGLPAHCLPAASPARPEAERHAAADALMAQAVVRHGGNRAFYSPAGDYIQLPETGDFRSMQDYYATALHELTHWTGAKNRLARDFSGRFGDTAYAREELVAEMGAAFLCAHAGIDGQLQHAEYLAAWCKVLRTDKRAVVMAAAQAQKAADFVIGKPAAQVDEEEPAEAVAA